MKGRKQANHRVRRKHKAATADVLGPAQPPPRVPSKWREHYKRLIQLRQHMADRQQHLTRDVLDEQPTFSTHMADAGTDTYDRDLALGMLSSEQDAVYEIDEALTRIRNGTYGRCELTGKPIEAARMRAIPWTRFSTAAEKQLEQGGELKHTRLGPREAVTRSEGTSKPPGTT